MHLCYQKEGKSGDRSVKSPLTTKEGQICQSYKALAGPRSSEAGTVSLRERKKNEPRVHYGGKTLQYMVFVLVGNNKLWLSFNFKKFLEDIFN